MINIRDKATKETEFRYRFCSICLFAIAECDTPMGPFYLTCSLADDLYVDYFENNNCPDFKKLDKKTIKKEKDVKTRQSELLEMYPNVDLYSDGVIDLKPCRMDTTMFHRGGKCEQYNDCDKCRRDFWMAQLKHD